MTDSEKVIQVFITLNENIANSKTSVLDCGGNDMTFYHDEIHIIKMIGHHPGIYSSKIAQQFGIIRAVIHKTLLKLKKRHLVRKEIDAEKKLIKLFLTKEGTTAYEYHKTYHKQHDSKLFDFLSTQSAAIKCYSYIFRACRSTDPKPCLNPPLLYT